MPTTFEAGGGRTLSYTRRGAGSLVVCVPGGPGMDPEAYFADLDLPGYELLIFAPRGTGASSFPEPPGAYLIADYVSDVEALREHLDLEQLTLYGNSHGGCVALAYAAAYPQRVARLIVANAPHAMGDGQVEAALEARARFTAAFVDGEARLEASDGAGSRSQRSRTRASASDSFGSSWSATWRGSMPLRPRTSIASAQLR